jgi:hypothetical protein
MATGAGSGMATGAGSGVTTGAGSGMTTGVGSGTSAAPANLPASCWRFRVTVTGFDAYVSTIEPVVSPDGRGDEVYAATVAVLRNRKTNTTSEVEVARTSDYGDVGSVGMWPGRIKAGSLSPEGGISTANGAEQVTLQSPLVAWEGTISEDDVLFIVPTIWEKDLDPSFYTGWRNYWSNAPRWFFENPSIMTVIAEPDFRQILNPLTMIGTPITVPLQDLGGNVRDHPIGTEPQPPAIPVLSRYTDRLLILTRQKLAGLSAGGTMNIPVNFAVMAAPFAREHYTLYVSIQRLP